MLQRRKPKAPDCVAIDLGGFHTRLYSPTEGLLLDEPSVGALDMDHQVPGAAAVGPFGHHAVDMLAGQEKMRLVKPVQSDEHNPLGLSNKMLGYFIAAAKRANLIDSLPSINLLLPHGYTEKDRQELTQTCINAGVLNVYTHDPAIATFLGAQLDKSEPAIIIDFGATGSRLIAIADNEVRHCQTLHCGGDAIDQAIIAGLQQRFDIQITADDARNIKHRIAAATTHPFVNRSRNTCQIQCLSIPTNTTTQFRIGSDTVNEILQPLLEELLNSIRHAFASVEQDIKDAVFNTAIQLCGGGALFSRVDQLVMEATNLPVEVINRPMTCGVRGAASVFNEKVTPLELVTESA